MITWATSDGRDEGGDRVVPAASTIKLFVASAFWRSAFDPAEVVEVPAVPWSLAVAVCSAPAALPGEVAALAGSLVRVNSS